MCYTVLEAVDQSLGCLRADCASLQVQHEFHQPFSDEEDDGGQHNEGPHSKAQRLRGASQQSLTGVSAGSLPAVVVAALCLSHALSMHTCILSLQSQLQQSSWAACN